MKNSLPLFSKLCFIALLMSLGGILLLNNPVSAIEMTMSPAKETFDLKKGQKVKGSFRLHNNGGEDLKVKIYPNQYEATNDGYKLESTTSRSLLYKWIKIDQPQVNIKANSSTVVDYTIEVPNDIPDGGQYGLIFAETINDSKPNQTGVIANSRLGMLIYATTDGQNRLEGNFGKVNIAPIQLGPKSTFSFNAKNSGNTHFNINATLTISDLFDNKKYQETKQNLTVLPELDKKFVFEWNQSPIFAIMKVNLKAGFMDQKINETKTVLFVSPAFFAILAIIILILGSTYAVGKKTKYKYKK